MINVLFVLGFHGVWLQQNVGNADIFQELVKQRLKDNFFQNWHDRIPRVLSYRNIAVLRFQEYLDHITVDNFLFSIIGECLLTDCQ
jgi:hypothetical protein